MPKVLVSDPISEAGIEILRKIPNTQVDVKLGLKPDELKAIIGDYDALAVRSETKVTADILASASKLQIIGRAGVGVDNIDVNAATQRGVVVVNSPEGNTLAAAAYDDNDVEIFSESRQRASISQREPPVAMAKKTTTTPPPRPSRHRRNQETGRRRREKPREAARSGSVPAQQACAGIRPRHHPETGTARYQPERP